MDTVFEASSATFPFHQLGLTSPMAAFGKQHFCKLTVNKKPLFIQSPKCKTKQGIIKSSKKMHTDLVFTNFDEELMDWIETLETKLRTILFANRQKWFDIDLSEDDIESYFNPTIKLFKSGKLYLLRASLNSNVRSYDETENAVDIDTINETTELITILEFTGITCSSKSFQLDVEIKQIMVIKPVSEVFNKCLIKPSRVENNLAKSSDVPVKTFIEDKDKDTVNNSVNTPASDTLDEPVKAHVEVPIEEPVQEPIKLFVEEPLSELQEFEFNDDELASSETMQLKEKTEVYYELYREARRKAKLAKSLALSSFLEAKRIKNLYMLDDIDSDESDMDELDNLDDYESLGVTDL